MKKKQPNNEFMKYSAMSMKMAIAILLFVMGGRWLDNIVVGIDFPLFTLLGALIGVALAIYIVIQETSPKA